jgi:hypothetical protein
MKMRRLRKRFQMVKPRGFIDFQPEVLETRTRRKSGVLLRFMSADYLYGIFTRFLYEAESKGQS